MESTTLIEMNDPKVIVRGFDLGHKIASNLVQVLTYQELEYFEQHLGEIPGGLVRFANRQSKTSRLFVESVITSIKASDTDLFSQLSKAEAFTKEYFGVSVKLAEIFQIPETVPWESVLPVFVPAGFNNRKGFELLQKLGLNSWEETDVMLYSNSSASDQHQLFLIQNSERPDKDTMGMSPNTLRETKKQFLNLKGYAMAMGLHHQSTKRYLDSKETFTWFPEDRLSGGWFACGYWIPGCRRVRFCWGNPDYECVGGGARLAISVSLET